MKRIVSLLLSLVLLLSITAGIDLSAYAAGLPRFTWFNPLNDSYVIDERANQFDFFETYDTVENLKAWANGKSSFLGFNDKYDENDLLDIYARKLNIVKDSGKPNTSLSEYERIAKIYQYVALTCTYDASGGTMVGESFIVRTGYCQTFSWLVNALCLRAGIECWSVDCSGVNHSWNFVKIDGLYYTIDRAGWSFLENPNTLIGLWKTYRSEVYSADGKTIYGMNSPSGLEEWLSKVGNGKLASSAYPKRAFEGANGDSSTLLNPTLGLATPSVISTTATSEGIIVKFKGVANADWYDVYVAQVDGTTNQVTVSSRDANNKLISNDNKGDFVYYKSSYSDGSRRFDFKRVKTIHSIDKNENGQYQCFIENGSGKGIIAFIVAKNVNGKCSFVDTVLNKNNSDALVEKISTQYYPSCTINGTSGYTAAEVKSANYAIYKSNAKHLATNGNHAYTKIKTIRTAGAGTQGADLYECKNCLQRQVKYTAAKSLATPKLSSVDNTATGVKITWGKVSGAAKYRVYYKVSGGSWTKIADTTSTSYTWKSAKSGTKYTFTVKCVSSDGKTATSSYDSTGKSITYIAAPKLSSVENTATGVKITWAKSTGAAKYRVYYKVSGGSWTKIADTTSTSYTWTGAKSGTKYTFTVRCLNSGATAFTSSYNSTGKSITYIAAPKLSSVENTASGVKITWAKSTGAAKYRVYYKTANGWTKIADTTSTSYTWTGAKSGTKYTFTVRCLNSGATAFTSSYNSTGKSITYIAAPKLSSVENTASGVKITWAKSTGAAKYRVYYKSANGWTKIADTTSTSYTWTGAKSGTKYTFTVRCLSSDGKSFTSSYNSTGKSITYIAAPKLSSVENTASGVKITWAKSTGAAKYRVYYKSTNGWTKIADTTSTSYTWTGAKSGTKYTFTVRCLNSGATAFTSSYNSTGKSITYVAAPKLSSVAKSSSGITIKWGAVTGAAKYRVYYKTAGGSWTRIADTTSTSYTWTGGKSGTKYTFTVRCINSNATAFTSGFDATGKSITK